jgi:hypothetical protein
MRLGMQTTAAKTTPPVELGQQTSTGLETTGHYEFQRQHGPLTGPVDRGLVLFRKV